jgi:hypothetical protein
MRELTMGETVHVGGGIAPLGAGALTGGALAGANAINNGASPAGVIVATAAGAVAGFYGAAVRVYTGITAIVSGLASGAAGTAAREAGSARGGASSGASLGAGDPLMRDSMSLPGVPGSDGYRGS